MQAALVNGGTAAQWAALLAVALGLHMSGAAGQMPLAAGAGEGDGVGDGEESGEGRDAAENERVV
jgi:hypothetical protein